MQFLLYVNVTFNFVKQTINFVNQTIKKGKITKAEAWIQIKN